jgi:hypothetical protein
MAKKLKKAILAGLTAYAGAKMLGEKQKSDWITKNNAAVMSKREGKPHLDRFLDDPLTGDGKGMESVYKPKHFKKKPEKKSWLPDWLPKWKWDGSGIGFRSKGGSAKSYSGGGAINTRLNGKVKFRTY